jgi:hypothetical protein
VFTHHVRHAQLLRAIAHSEVPGNRNPFFGSVLGQRVTLFEGNGVVGFLKTGYLSGRGLAFKSKVSGSIPDLVSSFPWSHRNAMVSRNEVSATPIDQVMPASPDRGAGFFFSC